MFRHWNNHDIPSFVMYSRKDIRRVWYSQQRGKDYMVIVPVSNVVVVNGTLWYALLRNDRAECGMFTIPARFCSTRWVRRNLSVSSHSESTTFRGALYARLQEVYRGKNLVIINTAAGQFYFQHLREINDSYHLSRFPQHRNIMLKLSYKKTISTIVMHIIKNIFSIPNKTIIMQICPCN